MATESRRFAQIGIDRIVRLKWLEKTLYLVLAGNDDTSISESLREYIKESFRSSNLNVRGSIDKTITILRKVWARVPSDLVSFRDDGLHIAENTKNAQRIALHWAMITAVYPFWNSVAIQTGRLLRLQSSVIAAQVQRRVKEQYGERQTASRATRRVMRSMIDWSVLKDTNEKGIYRKGEQFSLDNPRLVAFMVEALLRSTPNGTATMKDLLNSPSLFPFRMPHFSAEKIASFSPRLEVFRHGLDEEFLMVVEK